MAASTNDRQIETLLEAGQWDQARKSIEQALIDDPNNHWLLTQLGVTFYEQRDYEKAVRKLLASFDILPTCPLTLWNLAGAVDAIGNSPKAIGIYTTLLRSKHTAADDPCWESQEWTDALKTDCVYRIGVCLKRLKKWKGAEDCFRNYIDLILAGMAGTYSVESAAEHIRAIAPHRKNRSTKQVREAFRSTLQDLGDDASTGTLSDLSVDELLPS